MLSPDEIAEQQQLLATHRRTLAVYLRQQAEIGRAYSPPMIINGIDEARANIQRIKALLGAAGITVEEDPDDDEPPLPPPPRLTTPPNEVDVALRQIDVAPRQVDVAPREIDAPAPLPVLPGWAGATPPWLWPAVAIVAIALVAGVVWLTQSRARQAATLEATQTAEAAIAQLETLTAEAAPAGDAGGAFNLGELEGRMADANIALSAVQPDEVRKFLNDSNNPYRDLAEHALQVVGDQRFRQPIYLDELDTRYTDLVGTDHYTDYDADRLKEAMLRAWNEHYTDQQVDSYDQIVEGR